MKKEQLKPMSLFLLSVVLFGLGLDWGYATEHVVLGSVDGIPYRVNQWDYKMGNHRVLIEVDKKADAVFTDIQWRRRDQYR